jgi:hypothetical protein
MARHRSGANTTLATAVAHLGSGNDANGLPIYSTSTNLRALGLTASGNLNSAGIAGTGGVCYDAIVSIGKVNLYF